MPIGDFKVNRAVLAGQAYSADGWEDALPRVQSDAPAEWPTHGVPRLPIPLLKGESGSGD